MLDRLNHFLSVIIVCETDIQYVLYIIYTRVLYSIYTHILCWRTTHCSLPSSSTSFVSFFIIDYSFPCGCVIERECVCVCVCMDETCLGRWCVCRSVGQGCAEVDRDLWCRIREEEEDEEESTAAAEAVEARDPGVFRLGGGREKTAQTHTHTHTYTHGRVCGYACEQGAG